jgi:polysaccharide pyruvyl transferase WcaK-like protein
MFGANMERFEILSERDRQRLVDHLRRFRLITVRDLQTQRYLASHGVAANVTFFPDPAFSLRPRTVFQRNRIRTIGFNVTPYLTKHFGETIICSYAGIISSLVDQGFEVRLIPHVYASDGNPGVDDQKVLRRLYDALPYSQRERVILFRNSFSLQTIAEQIKQVDLFVGARMHACLNALTLGKAVYFLAYSGKAEAMVHWLESDSPFAIVRRSFAAVRADQFNLKALADLIAAHDAWAGAGTEPVIIDSQVSLSHLPVWQRVGDEIFLSRGRGGLSVAVS